MKLFSRPIKRKGFTGRYRSWRIAFWFPNKGEKYFTGKLKFWRFR